MQILVAGASGFIGLRVAAALTDAGHEVRAMTRRPGDYAGAGEVVDADALDPQQVARAGKGCEAAYYFVHSLDRSDFEAVDAEAARAFGAGAAQAGIERIIYLGGLGDEQGRLSPHLRSRRSVESLLAEGGVSVTTLRAGIVVGHGGVSWEMTRRLAERLPVLLAPGAARTLTQPIAVADVVRYLIGVLDLPETAGRHYDVGGADVLSYADMLRRVSLIEGRHHAVVQTPVPLLFPSLIAPWLSLATGVDRRTGAALLGSMSTTVVAQEDAIRTLVPFEPLGYDDAVLAALGERAKEAS